VLYQCAGCGRQTSVTAGTIFQDTRTPWTTWFRALWWISSQKTGTSAKGLQQVLGLGSYETAWTWLHKVRRAMVRPGRDRLTGPVEVDEAYLGGVEEGLRGRQIEKKALIAVAVEEVGHGIGRIRLRRIPGRLGRQPAGLRGGRHRARERRAHRRLAWVRPLGETRLPAELLPRVHRVIALLKRWLLGTHQGAVTRAHLDYYLDEFTFRFNRRTSRPRGQLFYRLVQQAVAVDPAPYKLVVKGVRHRAQGQRRWRRHHNT
jgi:hypothetical protein